MSAFDKRELGFCAFNIKFSKYCKLRKICIGTRVTHPPNQSLRQLVSLSTSLASVAINFPLLSDGPRLTYLDCGETEIAKKKKKTFQVEK